MKKFLRQCMALILTQSLAQNEIIALAASALTACFPANAPEPDNVKKKRSR